ncbi:MAG: hypothetical protein COA79_22215 [Planctomycetota bacterium]|nr:MAG: hypothetical protein COA79_22215 [Planctomycetota bacterium]
MDVKTLLHFLLILFILCLVGCGNGKKFVNQIRIENNSKSMLYAEMRVGDEAIFSPGIVNGEF